MGIEKDISAAICLLDVRIFDAAPDSRICLVMLDAVCTVAPRRIASAGKRRRLKGSRTFIGVSLPSWG